MIHVPADVLRRRKGFHAWLAWRDELADWRGWGRRNSFVRPDVPKAIPPQWILRRQRWWAARVPPVKAGTTLSSLTLNLFTYMGGFVAQAASVPADSAIGQEFIEQGGKFIAVQLGDVGSHHVANVRALEGEWAERWRRDGVRIGAWDRTEQIADNEGDYAVRCTDSMGLELWIFNPEQPREIVRLYGSMRSYRLSFPSHPMGAITLGKVHDFPTGALDEFDAHLFPECFLETPTSDTTVFNSVKYWLDSKVRPERIHPVTLHKPAGHPQPPLAVSVAEARSLGVWGMSSYTVENTSPPSFQVMKQGCR